MVGKYQLEIGAHADGQNDFALGMTTSADLQDGGFSKETTQVNIIAVPGVMYAPGAVTDKSTGLTGEIIASCEDGSGNYHRVYVSTDSGSDGRFFSINSAGTLTERGAEDTTQDFIRGKTDMMSVFSEVYITSASGVVRWSSVGSSNTFNYSFFSFNDALAPHPTLNYEANGYFGDGNRLLRMTSAGGTPTVILTLATGQVIVALGIDPATGKMLISVVQQLNMSANVNSSARVLYYNGFSNKADKVVLVDEMIMAFYNVGAVVYVTYGRSLGYWLGSGIKFLRALDVTYDGTVLPYKHKLTNIGSTLYVVEKRQVLAFGPVVANGSNVFYYALQNNEGDSGNYSHISNIGSDGSTGPRLGLAFATAKFYTHDVMSIAAVINGGALFYSRRIRLQRPIFIRKIRVEFATPITTGSDNVLTLALLDDAGGTTTRTIAQDAANTQPYFDSESFDKKTAYFQVRTTIAPGTPSNVFGIRRYLVFYDYAE